MPNETGDALNGSDERVIDRRALFDAISRFSLGVAATAAIAGQVKATPAAETKSEELENFKYDIESGKGWVGPGGSLCGNPSPGTPVHEVHNQGDIT